MKEMITTIRAIIRNGDNVLLVLKNKKGRQYYSTPGGHMKEGETEMETLRRELMEETGYEVTAARHLFEFTSQEFRHVFYQVEIIDNGRTPTGEEYTDEWQRRNGTYKLVYVPICEVEKEDASPPFLSYIINLSAPN